MNDCRLRDFLWLAALMTVWMGVLLVCVLSVGIWMFT